MASKALALPHQRLAGSAQLLIIAARLGQVRQVVFPDGIRFGGKNLLEPVSEPNKDVVDRNSASWNQIAGWLQQLQPLRSAA